MSSSPIRSERLRANPSAQAFLLRNAGQDILVTLEEARQWFQLGFEIRDPNSRELIDIGAIPIPSFAGGEDAFTRQNEEEIEARNALAKDKGDDATNGNAFKNGNNSGNGHPDGGAAA